MTGRGPLATARALALVALAATAVACAGPAPVHWQKPGASTADWDLDEGTCRARALALAEKEFRVRASEVDSPVYGSGQTLAKQMAVHDARRRECQLFEACMRAKGYSPDKGAAK